MCGITALICKKKTRGLCILLDSLFQLQNRGYDSAGISYFKDNIIHTIKKASESNLDSLDYLKQIINTNQNIQCGIGHTRWATHGGKTDVNSHPHTSLHGMVTIVHNGIIENFINIRKFLNINVKSETDSELIAHLIEYYLEKDNSIEQSINLTCQMLEGTYGLAILIKDMPNHIYIVRNGSPLILAENDSYILVTSERAGLLNLFTHYSNISQKQIITINTNGTTLAKDSEIKIKEVQVDESPSPYAHWMIKEIYEQPQSILRALNNGGRINENKIKLGGIEILEPFLLNIKNIILLGCGTSYNACMAGYYYLRNINYLNTIQYIDGAEFSSYNIPKIGQTLIVFCSQSGETKDLHRAISIAKNHKCFTMGIVNVVDSFISRDVDCGIYMNARREVSVASTKSFTSMVLILSLFYIWLSQRYVENILYVNYFKDINNLSDNIKQTLNICEEISSNIISQLNKPSIFILGKGPMEAIAKEGALKIKEVSYIHAEGYNGSALKHGPFALLKENFPVILIIDKENRDKMYNVYQEVLSRNAYVLVITELPYTILPINSDIIYVPENRNYQSILYMIIMQYMAYKLSLLNHINPDRPQNLAKVVTVE